MNTTNTQDRYEITDDGAVLEIKHPNSRGMITAQLFAGAIRQQARDLEQLRGELAAAVEEREKIRTMYIEAIERFCDDLQALRERAEQAEARLAAIDGAPTVAIAVHTHTDRGPYKHLSYSELNVPRDGVELIARTAKD